MKKDGLTDFGSRMRYLIENVLNTTQGNFSMKTDINPGGLSKILNGGVKPGVDKLENIANAYPGVNMEWLITGRGTPLKVVQLTEQDVRNHPLYKSLEDRVSKLEQKLLNFFLGGDLGKLNPVSFTASEPLICRSFFAFGGQIREQGVGSRI